MVAVHTQSAAQCGSLASLAVNDSVIARRFYSGQFDFKKRDAVGLDTAQPHSRTTKVNLVHVVERVHRTLLRGGLNLYNSTVWTLCRYEKYPRNIQWRDSGTPVQRRRDVRPFLPFINALSGAVASTPHAPPAIALSTCRHDANPRLSQPANHLAKFDQFLIGHEAQTFAQLLQFGLRWIQKQWTSPVSPAAVGTALYCGRCTNRCTTSFRPCPISPTVAVTAEVASSSLVVPAIHSERVTQTSMKPTGCKKTHFCTLFVSSAPRLPSLLARLLRAALLQVGNRCAGQHRRKHERKYSCLRCMLRRRDRLRINIQCRPEGGVSQQLLHHLQIRADTPQRTRIGMSKSMPSDSLLDSQRSRRRS